MYDFSAKFFNRMKLEKQIWNEESAIFSSKHM